MATYTGVQFFRGHGVETFANIRINLITLLETIIIRLHFRPWLYASVFIRFSATGALYAIARPSVRQSVCLSLSVSVTRVDWISQKWAKLGSCNFHQYSPVTLVSSWLISPLNSKGNSAGAPNKRGVGNIRNFQPISRRILETVQVRLWLCLLWLTNRKSRMPFRLVPIDDLGWPWTAISSQIFSEFCATSHIWEATTTKRMDVDPYYRIWRPYSPV